MSDVDMGIGIGILRNRCVKLKNRFRFTIANIFDTVYFATPNTVPCLKAGRPSVSFGEEKIEHLTETISFPLKPEWQTLEVTLWDIIQGNNWNPMFMWLASYYYPDKGGFGFAKEKAKDQFLNKSHTDSFKFDKALLEVLDGCGNTKEKWIFEGIYPQKIDWGELDMSSNEIVVVNVSFRYDRAYQDQDQ